MTEQAEGFDGEEGGGGRRGRAVFSYKETERENVMGIQIPFLEVRDMFQ